LKATCKPPIAAAYGFALRDGCELATIAVIAVASENTRFGQTEIILGVAPWMGGAQRLTRAA